MPTAAEKMRNHLAQQMLDSDALQLFQAYKCSLNQANDTTILDGTIAFLEHTSRVIRIFRDTRPVTDHKDERVKGKLK